MKKLKNIDIEISAEKHIKYIDDINDAIEIASKQRGTGIAKRSFEYLSEKIKKGKGATSKSLVTH